MVMFLYMWYTFGVKMIKIECSLKPEYFHKYLEESLMSGWKTDVVGGGGFVDETFTRQCAVENLTKTCEALNDKQFGIRMDPSESVLDTRCVGSADLLAVCIPQSGCTWGRFYDVLKVHDLCV